MLNIKVDFQLQHNGTERERKINKNKLSKIRYTVYARV